MNRFLLLPWMLALLGNEPATSRAYYFRTTGDDNASGRTPFSAWKTLAKLKDVHLNPGDSILLQGGQAFSGGINLENVGSGKQSTIVSSFGKGRATVLSGDGNGIRVRNCAGIRIANLEVIGRGIPAQTGSGIEIVIDRPGSFGDITISSCHISGFHDYGILIHSLLSGLGLHDIEIRDCKATKNGEAGIGSAAVYPEIPHRKFKLVHCVTAQNPGLADKKDNHSGNGIVLSGVDGFVIDSCEAFENGKDCHSEGGGPVGIWVWNCHNGIIENSRSHHNLAGIAIHDGGGFDIDGGSSGCTIRNCLSNDNEGAGYLVCEFGSPQPFADNQVVGNTSINDGLRNGYGAITVAGASDNSQVTTTKITGNRIVVENKNPRSGTPSAIYFANRYFSDLKFEDNTITVTGGGLLLRIDSANSLKQVIFAKNHVRSGEPAKSIQCEKCNPAEVLELFNQITQN